MAFSTSDHIIVYSYGAYFDIIRLNSSFEQLLAHQQVARLNELKNEFTETCSSCTCVSTTSKFSVQPLGMFTKEENKSILKTLCYVDEKDYTLFNSESKKHAIETTFYLNNKLVNQIHQWWPMATFYHHSSLIFDQLDHGVHVFISKQSMEISYIKDQKVAFYNVFEINNKEESIYYLSVALEKHKLHLHHTPINVYADNAIVNEFISFWKKYIPQDAIKTPKLNSLTSSINHLIIP